MPFHPRFSFIYFFQFLIIPVEEGGEGGKMMKGEQGHKKKPKIKKDPQRVVSLKSALYYPRASPSAFGGHPRRTWRL